MKKSILATILAVTLLLTSSSVAFASGNSLTTAVNQQAAINQLNVINQKSAKVRAINDKMDPYVKVVNNQYVLNIPENIQITMDPAAITLAKQEISSSNKAINDSKLTIDAKTRTATMSTNSMAPMDSYGDTITYSFAWYGINLWMSPHLCTSCAIALTTGGGIAAVDQELNSLGEPGEITAGAITIVTLAGSGVLYMAGQYNGLNCTIFYDPTLIPAFSIAF